MTGPAVVCPCLNLPPQSPRPHLHALVPNDLDSMTLHTYQHDHRAGEAPVLKPLLKQFQQGNSCQIPECGLQSNQTLH